MSKPSPREYRIDTSLVLPDVYTIWQAQGKHTRQPSPAFIRAVELTLGEAVNLVKPKAVFAQYRFDSSHKRYLNTDWENTLLKDLPDEVKSHIDGVIGVVCTIGEMLEAQVRQHFACREFLTAYTLDQIGTLAVARLAQYVADLLSADHNTYIWAPGNLDATLIGQRALFEFVPTTRIGVRLTKRNVMSPVKSLSFGLFTHRGSAGQRCEIPCNLCAWNGACKMQYELHS